MILGFYYHSNIKVEKNRLIVPGYIGVFIDELARNVKKLYLFLEEQTDTSSTLEDYELQQNNIVFISLGKKSTFYHRLLFSSKKLDIISQHINELDILLLRTPTPLAPNIYRRFRHINKIQVLIVGDYVKGLQELKQPFLRKSLIVLLTYLYQYLHNIMIKNSHSIVNSIALYNQYLGKSKSLNLIKTTTLSSQSFYLRQDTCGNNTIKLLYTGRINFQKGLRELIDATALLSNSFNIEIHIVGWEEPNEFSYTDALIELSNERGIPNLIFFHGKKKIGDELNRFYRMADIYVIPSYHEGFPRTIWEAMSNGLPVIASKVGSIPHFLNHKQDSYLINAKSVHDLELAIREIISNADLRRNIISTAYKTVKDNTLEIQTANLVKIIAKNNEK